MSPMGPITRISMSLALLTLSILLTGDLFFGARSDTEEIKMEARRRIAESLAIQFSSLVAIDDLSTIRVSLQNLTQRDDDILSAALRTRDGKIRAEAGNHIQNWQDVPFDKSTLTHTQVPIFKNNSRWGTVEIRFSEEQGSSIWADIFSPFVLLASYVFLAGFIAYLFFMRRTLRHLDPSAVIPDRVKTALDALSEGVVLVDDKQQVVLANTAMVKKQAWMMLPSWVRPCPACPGNFRRLMNPAIASSPGSGPSLTAGVTPVPGYTSISPTTGGR